MVPKGMLLGSYEPLSIQRTPWITLEAAQCKAAGKKNKKQKNP